MVLLEVSLADIVTQQSRAVLLNQMIKHIAYNTLQIPYNYEGFKFMYCKWEELKENGRSASLLKQLGPLTRTQANSFYEMATDELHRYEFTFKSLESELSLPGRVEEVVIALGPTLLNPKRVYRIILPEFIEGHSSTQHPPLKNLDSFYRSLINSSEVNASFENCGITTTFILLRMKPGFIPQSSTFVPKEDFHYHPKVPEIIFSFNTPDSSMLQCSCKGKRFNVYIDTPCKEKKRRTNKWSEGNSQISGLDTKPLPVSPEFENTTTRWFVIKEHMKGFKDCYFQGMSAFNFLLHGLPK